MRRNRKGNIVLALGGILAIVAIAMSGFFLWQRSQNTAQPISVEEKKEVLPPDGTTNWKTFTFKENPVSFKYPQNLNLLYFSTDTTGKFETDRMASGENAVIKKGENRMLGINPNQVGMGFSGEEKYIEEFLTVNGNQVAIEGVPVKKYKSSDGSYFSLISYRGKIILASCFSEELICDQILSTFTFDKVSSSKSPDQNLVPDTTKLYSCQSNSDCVFAKDPDGGCVIGVNKNYAGQFAATCVGVNGTFNGGGTQDPACSKVVAEAKCNEIPRMCPGSTGIRCVQNKCQVSQCIGEWKQ